MLIEACNFPTAAPPQAQEGMGLMDGRSPLPSDIPDFYEIHERRHGIAILATDFPEEWGDILHVLGDFRVLESQVRRGGGQKSKIVSELETRFRTKNWRKIVIPTKMTVGTREIFTRTHEVDLHKNSVALEIEWNNKDPFFDRDLDTFRHLFEHGIISVGVIITRSDELQAVFNSLGPEIGKKYGASTTHIGKLLSRLARGGGGGCPVVVFAIRRSAFVAGV